VTRFTKTISSTNPLQLIRDPQHLRSSSCECRTDELGEEGDSDDTNDVTPDNTRVEKADVGVQSRESEVERQEKCADKILDLLCYFDSKATLVGADQSSHERSEDRMNTDNASEERRSKGKQKRETDDALTGSVLECACSAQMPDENWPDHVD
jgi:hypothetical protein